MFRPTLSPSPLSALLPAPAVGDEDEEEEWKDADYAEAPQGSECIADPPEAECVGEDAEDVEFRKSASRAFCSAVDGWVPEMAQALGRGFD